MLIGSISLSCALTSPSTLVAVIDREDCSRNHMLMTFSQRCTLRLELRMETSKRRYAEDEGIGISPRTCIEVEVTRENLSVSAKAGISALRGALIYGWNFLS